MTFGEKLRKYRTERHMSQDELASILGTSKQVISRYESGQRSPKIGVVQEYAQKLNLPILYLIDDQRDTEESVTPLAMKGEGKNENTVRIAGRDGSFIERQLTDEQADLLRRMIEQMPEFED